MAGTRTAWVLAAGLGALMAVPGHAQNTAGQRPGPDDPAQPANPAPAVALPTATPMTDLLTRMDALETQVARLTAQNEEVANRQRQIEARLGGTSATVAATSMGPPDEAAPATPGSPPSAVPAPVLTAPPVPVPPKSAATGNLSAMPGAAPERAAGPAHPSAQRVAAVKAVIKPKTGDDGLDEYSYGFRLYTAKFYPEAAQQLKFYVDKFPRDSHISLARNLLGRAYLDDGKPRDAAPWFLTNYKTDPHGLRAPDSLLNLAAAMRQMGDDTRACIALNEFGTTYTAEAQGRLRQDYAKTRNGLTCS